jgi:NAD(P)-dependent dehydrogenase (short-subunit alcohol dehydrogenase family)
VGRLDGKKALITGGGAGIGRACGAMMAREGALVALADINVDSAAAAAAAINREQGERAYALRLDVTSPDQWITAVGEAEASMGGLNVLVNCAGICLLGTVEDTTLDVWQRTIDTDLTSVFLGCKHALGVMARHAPGSIVNIASISGLIAGHNLAAYNAAKAGVWLMTKSVALHAARAGYDVRANSVHPSFIDTAMLDGVLGDRKDDAARAKLTRQIPLGRIGTVEDVGYAVIYLASDESRFMTGAEIKLDGGLSAQ